MTFDNICFLYYGLDRKKCYELGRNYVAKMLFDYQKVKHLSFLGNKNTFIPTV